MSFVNLCYAAPGKMTRKKVDIVLTSSLANVRVEAAQLAGKPKEEIVILHQGNALKDSESLASAGVKSGGLLMVIHKKIVTPPSPPPAVHLTDDEVKRFNVAFGSAIRHPAFNRVVRRLLLPENMASMAAACPGLSENVSAQAFLTRPELLLQLLDPDTLKRIGESHPSLIEAANNLAAAVHGEEQAMGGGGGARGEHEAAGGSYFLDEMSDEEMEEEGGGAAGGIQRARSFNAITPQQLQAALAGALGGGGGGGNPFLGVTGMGPAAAERQRTTPSGGSSRPLSAATTPSARITSDMFAAAMQAAMGAAAAPPAAAAAGPAPADDLAAQVGRMREMGIADEGLAVRALQVMGGDLQAAVDLILSGWLGDDDAAA